MTNTDYPHCHLHSFSKLGLINNKLMLVCFHKTLWMWKKKFKMSTQINMHPHGPIVLLLKNYTIYCLKCVQLVDGQHSCKVKERLSHYQQLTFKMFK